jgi:Tfp pilus assembly protein PilX
MKKHTRQLSASRSIIDAARDKTGGAALITIILLLAFLTLITASVAYRGLSDAEVGASTRYGTTAILAAESCAEEAMLRISRNANYSGGTLDVGDTQCTINVSGNPCGSCTIDVTATGQNLTRRLQVDVTRSGNNINITSWEEID